MSPAGYWPQLHAAIEAGADSVYFGLKHFTARAKVGFSLQELPEALRTLHRRGVKGFITFNTLVFEHELAAALKTIEAIAEAGADALIVQDLGILKLAKQIAPELELHGSTQMSVTNAEGVAVAQELGATRVTLARELSLKELRAIRAQTSCELEIFVHGALCVAYSGQCFSSEAWGGRSANRGQCAQACRLPYELIVDDEVRLLGDSRYLLSPGDLYALEQIPEIVRIGISALKIEGRYKDADYVALATKAYRDAVDRAWDNSEATVSPVERLRLEQVYSRGLGPYFLTGTNHQIVVRGRAPRHRGVLLGRVTGFSKTGIIIEPADANNISPLKAGDGIVFDAADWRSPEEREEGGRVYKVRRLSNSRLELQFAIGPMDMTRVRAGDRVWRTHDPDLDRAVRPFLEAAVPVRKQPVSVRVIAREGEPLRTEWVLVNMLDIRVTACSSEVLSRAQNRAVSQEFISEQLGRLGNTAYELARLELELAGSPFIPASILNQLRRLAVDQLVSLQEQPRGISVSHADVTRKFSDNGVRSEPRLHLLVRTPEQLEAALACRPGSITLDYLDLYGLRPSVDKVRSAGVLVRVASPRILKPGEERITAFLIGLGCPILVRSGGLLWILTQRGLTGLVGDFSLNAANSITTQMLLELGLERITPGHDLNAMQIAELARAVGPSMLEVVAYQHLPVFHTEHCVFCRFLSTGTSYKDCGRPCEKHRVSVRDTSGRAHPVMADIGCRNTVFGAEAQQASAHLDAWLEAEIAEFRLEFVHESADELARISGLFEDALRGRINSATLNRELKRTAPQGATEGSLYVPKDYLTLPVLQ